MRQAYHAITLGFYESELLRRIDPRHRSIGQSFQDEIASPLGTRLLYPSSRVDPECQAGDAGCNRARGRHFEIASVDALFVANHLGTGVNNLRPR